MERKKKRKNGKKIRKAMEKGSKTSLEDLVCKNQFMVRLHRHNTTCQIPQSKSQISPFSSISSHQIWTHFLFFYLQWSRTNRGGAEEDEEHKPKMGVPATLGDDFLRERAAKMRESLQKSQTITDNVVSILGSFDHRLSALETAMRPTQVCFHVH